MPGCPGTRVPDALGARMAQLLEAPTTDPRVRGSSPWHDQTITKSEESRQLSVIPGIGTTRGNCSKSISFLVS